ncbi:MAG TPA: hypothetical protein VIW68_00415 [Candidatus Sulfotelmatobacter sp.]
MGHNMRQSCSAVVIPAAVAAVIFLVAVAGAQTPVTLQEQLDAQYKVAKIAGAGTVVVEGGTVLVVQRAGIKAMPFRAIPKCAAKFEDNTLHLASGFFCTSAMALQNYFQKGNKVYPLKLEVDSGKEKIIFRVVSCDECNSVDPPTGLKGEVEFEFPKGYLEKASAGEVEDTIGQVFAISDDDQQQDQANEQEGQQAAGMSQQAGGRQQAANQQSPPQQRQAEPQTVQLGMTTDQVQATLGSPGKVFNLGAKQIYVYKDVKVTFLDGKVNDVQ